MAPTADPRPLVLVTGAARGIGRAIAEELAPDHDLILGGRDQAALSELASGLPGARTMRAELTAPAEVGSALAGVGLDAPGVALAGIVHSAGILVSGRIDELSAEEWARSFAVNVVAVADLTRRLLPALRRARGTVVTINSGSGFTAGPGGAAYAASKFALRAFTDSLRAEERAHGVRVASVHPGRVDTDMQHELRSFEAGEYRAEEYLRPESVARAVRFALDAPADASVDQLSIRPR